MFRGGDWFTLRYFFCSSLSHFFIVQFLLSGFFCLFHKKKERKMKKKGRKKKGVYSLESQRKPQVRPDNRSRSHPPTLGISLVSRPRRRHRARRADHVSKDHDGQAAPRTFHPWPAVLRRHAVCRGRGRVCECVGRGAEAVSAVVGERGGGTAGSACAAGECEWEGSWGHERWGAGEVLGE